MYEYLIIVPIGLIAGISGYYSLINFNHFQRLKQDVFNSLGNLKAEYQRRKDLFNNLKLLIVSYIKFESGTYKDVTDKRKEVKEVNIDSILKEFAKPEETQGELFKKSLGLPEIKAVSERYPKLKAFVEYKKILEQIEKSEDRIKEERINYNKSVMNFNKERKVFPRNLIGWAFGFKEFDYFEDIETEKFDILEA